MPASTAPAPASTQASAMDAMKDAAHKAGQAADSMKTAASKAKDAMKGH